MCPHTHSLMVKGLSQGLLSEHEALTLARAYGQRSYPILPTLVRLVQGDLRKQNYTHFSALEAALAESCHDDTAFIEPSKLRHVCHAAGLPLPPQLLDGTVMK